MSENSGSQIQVGIAMGSASDADTMKKTKEVLDEFGIGCEVRVLSAHRTPVHVVEWIKNSEKAGVKCFIAAAGLAAHLAGAVAAHTKLPVIGVPMSGGSLGGFDSLLATVQMPKGTPVATVAIGSAGAVNAALLAVRILALSDPEIDAKLDSYQEKVTEDSLAADRALEI